MLEEIQMYSQISSKEFTINGAVHRFTRSCRIHVVLVDADVSATLNLQSLLTFFLIISLNKRRKKMEKIAREGCSKASVGKLLK